VAVVDPNYLPKPGPTHGPSQGWENRGAARPDCDAIM
jgi:hypothetical protein